MVSFINITFKESLFTITNKYSSFARCFIRNCFNICNKPFEQIAKFVVSNAILRKL